MKMRDIQISDGVRDSTGNTISICLAIETFGNSDEPASAYMMPFGDYAPSLTFATGATERDALINLADTWQLMTDAIRKTASGMK
jgi:hypothetical protein